MIIFGTRTLNSNAGAGFFNCPRCGCQQHYRHQKANRWFTLYFIPVIPLGTAGEYIECGACAGTFAMDALHYNPEAERAQLYEVIRRLVVLAMLHAGRYQPVNVARLREAMQQLSGDFVSEDLIHQDAHYAHEAAAQLEPVFGTQTGQLNAEGKTLILQLALDVLAADGTILPSDHQVLHRAAAAMAVPPDVVGQLIAQHACATV